MSLILTATDGCVLRGLHWPACGNRRGSVLMVHGLGEHAGRYRALAEQIAGWKFDVFAYDLRGHGRSEGRRGGLPSDDAMLGDLALMIDHMRDANDGQLILLGHSMGGLLAARMVAEDLAPQPAGWLRSVDHLVLSSPAFDPGLSALQRGLLAVLGRPLPWLPVHNGLRPGWISRDPAVVHAYRDDPLVHDRITPRLARFIVAAGAKVIEAAPHWHCPTLLLYAGSDRCVSPRGSASFAVAAPTSVVCSQAFPALYHEIFNEPERDDVIEALQHWLDQAITADGGTAG